MNEYIGDGVYVSFDGYHIKLETLEGNVIYLEDTVYLALRKYGDRIFLRTESDVTSEEAQA